MPFLLTLRFKPVIKCPSALSMKPLVKPTRPFPTERRRKECEQCRNSCKPVFITPLNFSNLQFRQKDGAGHFQDWTVASQ